MKAFPYYCQLDGKDCGSTLQRMIAKHYGKEPPVVNTMNGSVSTETLEKNVLMKLLMK